MIDDPQLAAIRARDAARTPRSHAGADVVGDRHTLLRRLDAMTAERDIARAELIKAKQDYCTESSAWKGKRESLVAERDSVLNQGLGFSTVMNEMKTEFAKVSARLDAMTAERDALRKYGRHPGECRVYARSNLEDCTCGLTALLRLTKFTAPPREET